MVEVSVFLAAASLLAPYVRSRMLLGRQAQKTGSSSRPAVHKAIIARVHTRRLRRQHVEQLPEVIGSIGDAVRAGMSLPEALAFAAEGAAPPTLGQLDRVVQDVADGQPLEVALAGWAAAVDDRSVELLVAVLTVQRRTGGDIPAVLDGVARTVADRARATREIGSFTAQARLSATVIVLLPVGFLGFLGLTSPGDLAASFDTSMGLMAFVIGVVLDGLAFIWMRSLLRVEV